MRGWTWQFGTLFIGVGVSGWLAYSNIVAAYSSGASDTLAYSLIADAVLFFFGLAFWHYHALGRNIACVVLGSFWIVAAAYVCASNIVKLQGDFNASWQPVEDAKTRYHEAMARLDVRINDAREHLKNAEMTALSGKTSLMREGAERQARDQRANIAELEKQRNAPMPRLDQPAVKHFAMGLEHIMPIVALLVAQAALWATFNSESLVTGQGPSASATVPVAAATPVTPAVTAPVISTSADNTNLSQPIVDLRPDEFQAVENKEGEQPTTPPVTAAVMDAVTLSSPVICDGRDGKVVPFTRTSETPVTDLRRQNVPWSKIAAHLKVSEATARRRYAAEAVKQSGGENDSPDGCKATNGVA